MKNTLKIVGLLVIIAMLLLTLTGCSKKIVATRTYTKSTDGMDATMTVEAVYNGDEVKSIKYIYEYSDEALAKNVAEISKAAFQNVELDGTTITIELSQEEYLKLMGQTDASAITQEQFKTTYEAQGYTVK